MLVQVLKQELTASTWNCKSALCDRSFTSVIHELSNDHVHVRRC